MKASNGLFALLLACIAGAGCQTTYERAFRDAQRNLEPEPGILAEFDSYYYKVGTLFSRGYEEDVVFRMVCLPSFEPEWLVGIRKVGEKKDPFEEGGTYAAFVLRPEKHIWKTELIPMYESGRITRLVTDAKGEVTAQIATNDIARLKSEVPRDFRKIGVVEKSEAIDVETARLLAGLWSGMLLAARHPVEPSAGLDGVSYHFSMFIPGHGVASGKIWTPSPDTRTGMLSTLGELIAAYVDAAPGKRKDILNEIQRTAGALRRKL